MAVFEEELSEMTSLEEEFGSIFQESMRDLERYSNSLSDRQQGRAERDHERQIENLNEIMESMREVFDNLQEDLSDADRALYETMFSNRERDLRWLERDYRRRNRTLQRQQRNFFSTMEEAFESWTDDMQKFASIATAIDVAGLKDSLTDSAQSNVEILRSFQSRLNLSEQDYNKFKENLMDDVRELNSQYNNIFSSNDYLEIADKLISDYGIRDTDWVADMAKQMAIFNKSTGMDGSEGYEGLVKILNRDKFYDIADDVAERFNNLALTGQTNGFNSSAENVVTAVNTMSDSIIRNAKTEDELYKHLENLSKATDIAETSYIGTDFMTGMFQEILNSNPSEIAEKYAWTGLDVRSIRSSLESGNYDDVLYNVLQRFSEQITAGNTDWLNAVKEATGLDDQAVSEMVSAIESNPNYYRDLFEDVNDVYADTVEKGTTAAEVLGKSYVSQIDRMKNAVTTSEIGSAISDIIDDLDLSISDVILLGGALKNSFGFVKNLVKGGGNFLSRLLGGTGDAASILAMQSSGGMLQATSGTALARIIGSTGTATISGSGILGGLSSTGAALGSTATTGTGLAVAGGAAIAGGALGAAGLVSAAMDLVEAKEAATWQKKEVEEKSAATKAGLVAAGAAIGSVVPGVGTLIGAGVGGLLALIGGDKVAQAFQDWSDGTQKIKETQEALADAQEKVNDAFANDKEWKDLRKNYDKVYSDLKNLNPQSEAYNQKAEELKGIVEEMNGITPGLVQVEKDGITIKERSLDATEKMYEAEKALAKIRASQAIDEAVDTADELGTQLSKSLEKGSSNDTDIKVANALVDMKNAIKGDDLSYYARESIFTMYNGVRNPGRGTAADDILAYNDNVTLDDLRKALEQEQYDRVEETLRYYYADEADTILNNIKSGLDSIDNYTEAAMTLSTSDIDKVMSDYEALKNFTESMGYDFSSQAGRKEAANLLDQYDVGTYGLADSSWVSDSALDQAAAKLEKVAEQQKDILEKQNNYDNAYLDAINLAVTAAGNDLEGFMKDYKAGSLSSYEISEFKNLINTIDRLNSVYNITDDNGNKLLSVDVVSVDEAKKLVDGSHKDGLWRVPNDNYLARLHEGEAVLTKEDADKWREQKTNGRRYTAALNLSYDNVSLSNDTTTRAVVEDTVSKFLGNVQDAPTYTGKYLDYMNKVLEGAIRSYYEYSILPSITLSQGALESGWGQSPIGHNLFGIKAYDDWKGKKVYVDTVDEIDGQMVKRKQWFKDYDSFAESVMDHGKLLGTSSYYTEVRAAKNYVDACRALGESPYACGEKYGEAVKNLIEQYDFSYFDNESVLEDLAKKYNIPMYKQGTNYVPETQMALLHKGETVIPADERSIEPSSVVTASSNADIIKVLKWGIEFLGKKIEESQVVVQQAEQKEERKKSKTQQFFNLGGATVQ